MRDFLNTVLFAYMLIALGVYLVAAVGYDEIRGVTTKPVSAASFHRRGMGHAYQYRIPVRREQNSVLFRQFMTGHWIWAVGIEGAGWILFFRNR